MKPTPGRKPSPKGPELRGQWDGPAEPPTPEAEREAGAIPRLLWVTGGWIACVLAWEPATHMLLESPTDPTISPEGWLIAIGGSLLAAAAAGLGAGRTLPHRFRDRRRVEGAWAGAQVGMLAWVFGAMPALGVLSQASLIAPRGVGRSMEDTTFAVLATVPHDMAWQLVGLSLVAPLAGMIAGALSAGGELPRSLPAPRSPGVLRATVLYLIAMSALWDALARAANLTPPLEDQWLMGGHPSALTPDTGWVGVLILGSGVLCGMMVATWVAAMRRSRTNPLAVLVMVLCALPGGLMPFLVAPEMASWASPSWLALVLAGALAGAGAPLHEDTWEESLSDTATRDIILTLWALFGPMGGGALVTFNNLQLTNINRITSAGSEAVLDPDAVVSALMGIHDAVMYTSKSLFMFYAVAWVIGAAARSRSQG